MNGAHRGRLSPALNRRTVTMVLCAAALFAGSALAPAFADDDHGHDNRGDHGSRGHDRDHDRDRHSDRYQRYPVYAPPPAYYRREPSPGISLVFPFEIR
jgi:hypothetical protein